VIDLLLTGVLVVAGLASATSLEPYLAPDPARLGAQAADRSLPQVIRRRAMRRLVREFPDRAPDALVPVLYDPAGHINELAGELLWGLGRPHGQARALLQSLEQGRTVWTREQVTAFARAVSWRGHREALPILRRMVEEGWDTAQAAEECIARIEGRPDPAPPVRSPCGSDCARRRRAAFEAAATDFLATPAAARNAGRLGPVLRDVMEVADATTAPTLVMILAAVEEMRMATEVANSTAVGRFEQRMSDPGGPLREIIVEGLCAHPNPLAAFVLAPLRNHPRLGMLVAFALLRADDPSGLPALLEAWAGQPQSSGELFLVYTGVDVLPRGGYECDARCLERARAWYEHEGRRPEVQAHIAAVNRSGILDSLLDELEQ
jgi:hypothetical protein